MPEAISAWTKMPIEKPTWPDDEPVELEGGSIETNGAGILMTTEECLLGGPNWRNKGRTKRDYEKMFRKYLGIEHVLWLGQGFQPDQTQGHIDNVARFVSMQTILMSRPNDKENLRIYKDNVRRIDRFTCRPTTPSLKTLAIPATREPVTRRGEPLPSSYINFYIGNGTVIVPVFNDESDRDALLKIADIFPNRRVVGHYSRNVAWGYGNVHCLLQQQPI